MWSAPEFIDGSFNRALKDEAWFLTLGWVSKRETGVSAWSWNVALEYKPLSNHRLGYEPYLKARLEANYAFAYQRFRHLRFRFYGGAFILNEYRDRNVTFPWSLELSSQGVGDYLYEGYYFGRSDQSGHWWRQRSAAEGGFYSALPPQFRGQNGVNNNYLFALNLSADLPKPLPRNFPIRPFLNIGYGQELSFSSQGLETAGELWYEAGLSLEVFDGRLGLALPIIVSEDMNTLFGQNGQANIFKRLSFTFDLHQFDPREMREEIGF